MFNTTQKVLIQATLSASLLSLKALLPSALHQIFQQLLTSFFCIDFLRPIHLKEPQLVLTQLNLLLQKLPKVCHIYLCCSFFSKRLSITHISYDAHISIIGSTQNMKHKDITLKTKLMLISKIRSNKYKIFRIIFLICNLILQL